MLKCVRIVVHSRSACCNPGPRAVAGRSASRPDALVRGWGLAAPEHLQPAVTQRLVLDQESVEGGAQLLGAVVAELVEPPAEPLAELLEHYLDVQVRPDVGQQVSADTDLGEQADAARLEDTNHLRARRAPIVGVLHALKDGHG